MQEPRANIICGKPDRNIIGRWSAAICADSNNIASDGIDVVVFSTSCTTHHRERVL